MADEARSRQQLVEAVVHAGGGFLRSQQQLIEAAVAGSAAAQCNQLLVEVLVNPTFVDNARVYQVLVEYVVNPEVPDPLEISDLAYASVGFDAFEAGVLSIDDFGTEATFEVTGSIEPPPPPPSGPLSISDLAYATSTFVAENPTLIVISDLAYATVAFSISSALHITSTAIASNKAGTVLNGNPGILAENRDPW